MRRKNEVKPREQEKGRIKNDSRLWDFMKAPRFEAKTRKGTSCQAPAMKNGRCRLHGGKSTGPKTPEGIERIRQAHLKHGMYTKEAIAGRKEFYSLLRELRATIKEINNGSNKINIRIKKF